MSNEKILDETVQKINKRQSKKVVGKTTEMLSEKVRSLTVQSGPDNNCYTDFSSVGEGIVSQESKMRQDEKPSVFETLSQVNVNEKIESKNKMRYLSWAYAWDEAKRRYPNANYRVYETENGVNYFTDGRTCWVKTGVIIEGLEHIEYLPIMDFRNQSIPLAKVTSFDVNKSIQRSLTKALARHGLGLYIYSGEDLPDEQKDEQKNSISINEDAFSKLIELLNSFDKEESEKYRKGILKTYNISQLTELDQDQGLEMIQRLIKFKEKEAKAS